MWRRFLVLFLLRLRSVVSGFRRPKRRLCRFLLRRYFRISPHWVLFLSIFAAAFFSLASARLTLHGFFSLAGLASFAFHTRAPTPLVRGFSRSAPFSGLLAFNISLSSSILTRLLRRLRALLCSLRRAGAELSFAFNPSRAALASLFHLPEFFNRLLNFCRGEAIECDRPPPHKASCWKFLRDRNEIKY